MSLINFVIILCCLLFIISLPFTIATLLLSNFLKLPNIMLFLFRKAIIITNIGICLWFFLFLLISEDENKDNKNLDEYRDLKKLVCIILFCISLNYVIGLYTTRCFNMLNFFNINNPEIASNINIIVALMYIVLVISLIIKNLNSRLILAFTSIILAFVVFLLYHSIEKNFSKNIKECLEFEKQIEDAESDRYFDQFGD